MEDQLHHPLSICQKVFKFITRLFFTGLTASAEEKVQHQDQERHKDDKNSGSEVEVHLKQTEEDLDSWTPTDNLGSSVHLDSDQPQFKIPDTIATSSPAEATKDKEHPLVQVKGTSLSHIRRRRAEPTAQKTPKIQPTAQKTPRIVQQTETQKALSLKQSTENKDKEIANEEITIPIDSKEPKIRSLPHPLVVAPNINEKSESFIKSRMEAMRKHIGSEPAGES